MALNYPGTVLQWQQDRIYMIYVLRCFEKKTQATSLKDINIARKAYAALFLGTTQPRIADIMSLNSKHFSVDRLLKYLAKLGLKVRFVIEGDAGVA